MPRASKPSGTLRHDPLLVQPNDAHMEAKYGRISKPGKRRPSSVHDEDLEVVLDPKTSRRIIELAKSQQEELDILEGENEDDMPDELRMARIINDEEKEEEDSDEKHSPSDVDYGEVEEIFVSHL